MSENAASIIADIELDKKGLSKQIIKELEQAQTLVNKNSLVLKFRGDATEINKIIEKVRKDNPSVKINLKLQNTSLTKELEKEGQKAADAFEQSFNNIDLSLAIKKLTDFADKFDNAANERSEKAKDTAKQVEESISEGIFDAKNIGSPKMLGLIKYADNISVLPDTTVFLYA